MTFGESVLRFVRGESLLEVESGADEPARLELLALVPPATDVAATGSIDAAEPLDGSVTAGFGPVEGLAHEPGFADIEAAVELVNAGLARRVVLANFPSWPGLLWRAYQLAEETNVLILPTVVRPGGRVDIVVTRERE